VKLSLNFEHLRAGWPKLAELGAFAELYAVTDPHSTLVKLRCFVELVVGYVYLDLKLPIAPNATIHDKLISSAFTAEVDQIILDKLHAVRRGGNKAAHEGYTNQHDALWLLKETYYIGCWFYLAFAGGKAAELPGFTAPENQPLADESKSEFKRKNKQLQEKLAEQNARLDQALAELEATKQAEQLALQQANALKNQIDSAKASQLRMRTAQAKSSFDFNEAETRQQLIDAELRSRGWDVSLDGSSTNAVGKEVQLTGQPTDTGIGYCDYVLWDDNGKPLAVIEAKRTRRNVKEGREQAKLYADALEKQFGQRPVIFYTNGYDIYLWDDAQGYAPRQLYGYYSKDSLQYLILQRSIKGDLNKTPIDITVAGRDYQIETISRVCERFTDKHRKALVVQATGTGKTRVSIALVKRLLDAGWAKRVLFLCDRKELRKQAGNAFNEFTKEPLHIVGKSQKSNADNARIFIATYPGMLSIYQKYDVGYFDLIIADESHRSIYNVYGDLFKYFDALEVGLTATPVEMVSKSTCRLFGCDFKQPTANYPLEQAIADDNLVPFKVVSHTTKFLRDGIKGNALTDAQIAELEEQGIDPNELDFDAPAVDKAIFNKDTNRAILQNLMEKGLRDADGQLPGKTIIFARSIAHAELLAELFSEMYPQLGANFCRVIHSKYERAEELIENFKGSAKKQDEITIAVSVDMLDTGIDVPEVVNLVFAKPIKSKVKFWQMIGRGTRLCENLYGAGSHKTHFLIFDHWENFAYFELDKPEDDPVQAKSLCQKLFEARLNLAELALKKAEMAAFNDAILLIKADIDALDDRTIAVRDTWQLKAQLSDSKILEQFAPATRSQLRDVMAPLMQWRTINGESEALRFDLQMANLQYLALNQPGLLDIDKLPVLDKIGRLSMHLNVVRAKAKMINAIQKDSYWQAVTPQQLEQSRQELRGIIHLREKLVVPPTEPAKVIDVADSEYLVEERPTKLVTVDYKIYRQAVEASLQPLFETNPVLLKIRSGEAVTELELQQLNALVHTQNPHIDLTTLAEFYPESSVGLDIILRTIVGMDAKAIERTFMQFVQQVHTRLNARQQRFIALLKQHLVKYGSIEIDQLYQAPFNTLDANGLDGLFSREEADVIAQFVKRFNAQLGVNKTSIAKRSQL